MLHGIYAITNSETGRKYIGRSTDMGSRWKKHLRDLEQGEHFNERLQEAWDTYGPEVWSFDILEVAPEDLAGAERRAVEGCSSTYNVRLGQESENQKDNGSHNSQCPNDSHQYCRHW